MLKVLFKPNDITRMVSNYYQNTMGLLDVKVTIKNELGYGGYGMSESRECITTIKITTKKTILGQEYDVEQIFSEETIEEIFTTIFNSENLDLVNLEFDNGINSHWEGYGQDEHEVLEEFFKGINVTFKEQDIVRKNFRIGKEE